MAGVMRSCVSGLNANERSRLFGFTIQTKAVGINEVVSSARGDKSELKPPTVCEGTQDNKGNSIN